MVFRRAGFTLMELLVTIVIVSIIASVALPMAELVERRNKEQALRTSVRTIREALDSYKLASDEGKIIRKTGESGYPPSLEALVDGVPNAKSKNGELLYFLRRIPHDPFYPDTSIPAAKTWGKRSYDSSSDQPKEGDDVYDIYSLSSAYGLNGIPYRDW